MHHRYKLILIVNTILLCLINSAYGSELIWSETDDHGTAIYWSKYQNGALVKKTVIIKNGNINILPAISTSKNGSTMIVWSRITSNGSLLEYIHIPLKGKKTRGIFKTKLATNLAPVIVHDNKNIPWLFWSANNGKDDNIFFSRYISKKWKKPIQVNTKNSTPDILPEAGVSKDGTVWVTWQQLNNDSYIELTKTFKNVSSSNDDEYKHTGETITSLFNQDSSEEAAQISIPKQINTTGRIIHFSRTGDTSYNKSLKSK